MHYEKVKNLLTRKVSKVTSAVALSLTFALTTVGVAFGATTPAPLDLTPIQSAITGSITAGQIATIIGACIAGSMSFMLLWFGARKLTKAITGAFKTGKIKF